MYDASNTIFDTAASFIASTNYPVFLTGKAGTGKTTFLKYIKEHSNKNTAVVAPTGVAAINAGGVTIHSFFQLPFAPFLPETGSAFGTAMHSATNKHSLLAKQKLSAQRREVMQQLELLIIDEISMVRCDVLDAIDLVLRHVRNNHGKPFGGVQVLYIGDMYQLPPVVKDHEWQLLREHYDSPFFFSSLVCRQYQPVYIELQKVYRQKDFDFINLLNKVRNNEMDNESYATLHSRMGAILSDSEQTVITLATHNNIADDINNIALQKLASPARTFKAEIEGEFYPNAYPAEEILHLKEGAQVMFIKNDVGQFRRYYNGKIGTIKSFDDDKIIVSCKEGEAELDIELGREIWENINYTINKKTNQLEEEVLGTFKQYPLRLAWAITIHKSQGLTFEKVIIDAGLAFAPGQVYVALSRCTTLEGISLKSKISMQSLFSDERIVTFAKTQNSPQAQQNILTQAKAAYQQELITGLFDFKPELNKLNALNTFCIEHSLHDKASNWLNGLQEQFELFNKHGATFCQKLQDFFAENILPEENNALKERLIKAGDWFIVELSKANNSLMQCPVVTDNRQIASELNKKMQSLYDMLYQKLEYFNVLQKGFSQAAWQQAKRAFKPKAMPYNAYAGKSVFVPANVKHGGLYAQLKQFRDDVCEENGLATYMVCGHDALEAMANYLPQTPQQLALIKGFGAHKIKNYGSSFLSIIKSYAQEHNLDTHIEDLQQKRTKKAATVKQAKPDTKLITYDLYKTGKGIAEIAKERNLATSTIETHLAHYVGEGLLNIDEFVPQQVEQEIRKIVEEKGLLNSSEIKVLLSETITYGQIKMVLASLKKR